MKTAKSNTGNKNIGSNHSAAKAPELTTEGPLSEKDEVKKAESKMRRSNKKIL
ncbi:hypothetical protein BH09BAC6_BH09BAC6_04390 [soil metagenome]|jgi:hypothetical protein